MVHQEAYIGISVYDMVCGLKVGGGGGDGVAGIWPCGRFRGCGGGCGGSGSGITQTHHTHLATLDTVTVYHVPCTMQLKGRGGEGGAANHLMMWLQLVPKYLKIENCSSGGFEWRPLGQPAAPHHYTKEQRADPHMSDPMPGIILA